MYIVQFFLEVALRHIEVGQGVGGSVFHGRQDGGVSVLEALVVGHVRFEADDGEDDDAGEHGREAVGHGHQDGVPVAVVVDRVVGRKGNQPSERESQREKYLRARFQPNHRIRQLVPLRRFKLFYNKKSLIAFLDRSHLWLEKVHEAVGHAF